MAQRHPRDTPTSNPHSTAPPTRRAQQRSPWHNGTHATRPTAIRMAQRHPRDPPSSNPHGTAPPSRHTQQQSPWHSATHATRRAAILMAQRHPRDMPSSNPHGTPPTRHARQQSPWHSATHATRPPAIPMAQRHPRDPPSSNPHGTAPHTPHTRRARDADPHGTAAPTRPAQQQSPWHSAAHGTRATRPKRRSARHGINDAPRDDARRRDATATTPSGHTANEANTGPAPRPPDYKRGPFATHSGIKEYKKIQTINLYRSYRKIQLNQYKIPLQILWCSKYVPRLGLYGIVPVAAL